MSFTMRNNPVEDELDSIRLSLYEETKAMTDSEITEYIKKQIAPTVTEYNMAPPLPPRHQFRR
jgi:DNA-directed RNA polymerase subunit L